MVFFSLRRCPSLGNGSQRQATGVGLKSLHSLPATLERESRRIPLLRFSPVTLFAALSYLEGKIISRTEKSYTHLEWLSIFAPIGPRHRILTAFHFFRKGSRRTSPAQARPIGHPKHITRPASDKVPVHKLSHLEHRDNLLAVEYRQ